jgi:hypothetical protein
MITQKQEILNHIVRFGGITRATAANMYIFELSSRIGELASQGDDNGVKWEFTHTPIHGKRPGGRKWRIIRYTDPQRREPQRELAL